MSKYNGLSENPGQTIASIIFNFSVPVSAMGLKIFSTVIPKLIFTCSYYFFFFLFWYIVSTENIYCDIINKLSIAFCMLLKEKLEIFQLQKKYSARPGNTLLGITDAKEEILCRIKNIFKLRIVAHVLNIPQNFRAACCMYVKALIFIYIIYMFRCTCHISFIQNSIIVLSFTWHLKMFDQMVNKISLQLLSSLD